MTAKDYCSKVCGAKCCRAHEPIVWPLKCPSLNDQNLCSIYDRRIGFQFRAIASDGSIGMCVCTRPETFVEKLTPEIREQCCFAHPELLKSEGGEL